MPVEEEIVAELRRARQKVTPQRLMVLAALRSMPGHPSASEIFQEVRASYPYVDISTVYRTLASLRELGLVTETDMGSGDLRYQWASETPHHHLICQRCGHVAELEHDLMAGLGEQLRERHGFVARLDHFAIFGLCRECVAAEATGPS